MSLFLAQDNGLFHNGLTNEGRGNIFYGQNRL